MTPGPEVDLHWRQESQEDQWKTGEDDEMETWCEVWIWSPPSSGCVPQAAVTKLHL